MIENICVHLKVGYYYVVDGSNMYHLYSSLKSYRLISLEVLKYQICERKGSIFPCTRSYYEPILLLKMRMKKLQQHLHWSTSCKFSNVVSLDGFCCCTLIDTFMKLTEHGMSVRIRFRGILWLISLLSERRKKWKLVLAFLNNSKRRYFSKSYSTFSTQKNDFAFLPIW